MLGNLWRVTLWEARGSPLSDVAASLEPGNDGRTVVHVTYVFGRDTPLFDLLDAGALVDDPRVTYILYGDKRACRALRKVKWTLRSHLAVRAVNLEWLIESDADVENLAAQRVAIEFGLCSGAMPGYENAACIDILLPVRFSMGYKPDGGERPTGRVDYAAMADYARFAIEYAFANTRIETHVGADSPNVVLYLSEAPAMRKLIGAKDPHDWQLVRAMTLSVMHRVAKEINPLYSVLTPHDASGWDIPPVLQRGIGGRVYIQNVHPVRLRRKTKRNGGTLAERARERLASLRASGWPGLVLELCA